MIRRQPGRADRPVRRLGRVRRWIVRPVAWVLVVLVLLLTLCLWLVHHPGVQRHFLDRTIAQLEARLGRVVTVDEIQIRWFPLTVELEGIELAGPRLGDPSVAAAERIALDVDLLGLWRHRLRLDEIEIEGLSVFVEQLGPETNMPRTQGGQGSSADSFSLGVTLGSLTILDSKAVYQNLEVPLDIEARGVEASLLGQNGLSVRGTFALSAVDLGLNGGAVTVSLDGTIALDREGLELEAVRLTAADSALLLNGGLVWVGEPILKLEFSGRAHSSLARELNVLNEEIVGVTSVSGQLDWQPGAWGLRVETSDGEVSLVNAWDLSEVETRMAVDSNGLWLELLDSDVADGTLGGKYGVEWGDSSTSTLELRAENLDLATTLQSLDLADLGVAGSLRGHLNYQFEGSDWNLGSGWGNLEVVESFETTPRLGVSGVLPFTLDTGRLTTVAGRLVAEGQQADVSVDYDLSQAVATVGFLLRSTDLGPISGLIAGPQGVHPLWLPHRGSGAISGVVLLEPGAMRTSLDLDLLESTAPGVIADQVLGHLELTPSAVENLSLKLRRLDGSGLITGRVPFGEATTGLDLRVEAVGWPLAEVGPWLPLDLPIQGEFAGVVLMTDVGDQVVGRVQGRLESVTAQEYELGSVGVELQWDSESVTVEALDIEGPAGKAQVEGSIGLTDQNLDFAVTTDLNLDTLARRFSWLGATAGQFEATGRIEGTLAEPAVQLNGSAKQLIDSTSLEEVGEDVLVDALWTEGQLSMRAMGRGWLDLEGDGRLDAAGTDLSFRLEITNLEPLGQIVDLNSGIEGTMVATCDVSGSAPTGIESALLSIPTLDLAYGGHRVSAIEPVVVEWTTETLRVDSLFLGEKDNGGELFLSGTIGLQAESLLDLRVQASSGASWLNEFNSALRWRGDLDLLGTIGGSVEEPVLQAQASLGNGLILIPELGTSLEAVESVVLFDSQDIVLDHLRGQFGRGQLLGEGRVDWPRGDQPLAGRFQVAFEDSTVRYPEGVELRGDGEIVWTGGTSGQQLRGLVTLSRARYFEDLDVEISSLVEALFRREAESVETADEALAGIELNVAVRAPGAVRIKNNVADLKGSADLSLRGTLARPVLFGTLESEPGSSLQYGGNEYQLERGIVTFANPHQIEPLIDVEAKTQVAAYSVSVSLFGNLDRLTANLAADPPLPDAEVLGLLVGGRTIEESRTGGGRGGATTAESLLYGQATSLIGKRVGDLFGFDSLRVEPLSATGKSLSSARVSVGKRLSSRLYATYSYDPSSTANQRIQLEWQATDSLLVRVVQDDESYAVDLLWENSF